MSKNPKKREFVALNIAVLTVSDSRTEETDKSGKLLVGRLTDAGHQLAEKTIVPDDVYTIRAVVAGWIAAADVDVQNHRRLRRNLPHDLVSTDQDVDDPVARTRGRGQWDLRLLCTGIDGRLRHGLG
jgi:hypothetical protein